MINRNAIKRILKEAGAERVSDDALDVFHRYANQTLFSKASRCVQLSKHAKRKTVAVSDVKLAMSS